MSKRTIVILLFSIVLGLMFFSKTFNPNNIISGDDTISLHYPAFSFYHDHPSASWNPTLFGGYSTDIFGLAPYYPPLLLLKIFPPTTGFGIFLFCHFLMAFWGMYFYTSKLGLYGSSSLLSAVLFSCSSTLIGCVGQFVFFVILSILPFFFWALERCLQKPSFKNTLLMSIIAGFLLLQPHPQLIIYILIASVIYTPWRVIQLDLHRDKKCLRPIISLGIAVILALLIASPQLQALRELKQNTSRGAGMTKEAAFFGSLPPEEFFALYLPSIFGDWTNMKGFFPKPNTVSPYYWGRMPLRLNPDHIGIIGILLAFLSILSWKKYPPIRPIIFITLFFYSLCLGKYFLTYPVLYEIIPLFQYMRGPYRFIYIAIFFTSVLAGFGLDSILKQENAQLLNKLWQFILLTITALISGSLIFWIFLNVSGSYDAVAPYYQGIPDKYIWPMLQNQILIFQGYDTINQYWFAATIYSLFFAFIFIISFRLLIKKSLPRILNYDHRQLFAFIIIILITIEASLVSYQYLSVIPKDNTFYKKDKVTEFLLKQKEEGNIFRIHTETPFTQWLPNKGMLFGIESDTGYLPSVPNEYMEVLNLLGQSPGIFNLLNVRYILLPTGAKLPEQFTSINSIPKNDLSVFENNDVLPRFYIADNYSIEIEPLRRLQAILSPDVLQGKHVILEKNPEFVTHPKQLPATIDNRNGTHDLAKSNHTVTVTKYAPDIIELTITNPNQSKLLFIGNAYSESWHAEVNGTPCKLLRANHAFQAVEIPEGKSTVILNYKNYFLRNLTLLGWTTLSLTIAGLVITQICSRKNNC